MKAKLNELRLEAGISRLHDEPKFMVAVSKEGNVIEPLDGLEKFADLIIQECLDIANDTRYEGKVVANRIKFVFGVEE
jgi:hypothetical protein